MKAIVGVLRAVVATAVLAAGLGVAAQTPIKGRALVSAQAMTEFVQSVNPDFDPDIARAFLRIGDLYGLRGDIALCQAIIETGWFRYDKGTRVDASHYNFCGLGVTGNGLKGCEFTSIDEGVKAMMQHLYAYCCTDPLDDDEIVDPRFNLVRRGSATTWESLSNRWAMNPAYGSNILKLYQRMAARSEATVECHVIEVELPEVF